MSESTLKRKQPPTFRHLPINRAKKLKQTWVENKKIKSKWKAQKRREEASMKPNDKLEQSEEEDKKASESESDKPAEDADSDEEASDSDSEPEPQEKTTRKYSLHPSRAHIHPELAPRNPRKRAKITEPDAIPAEPPSLRELTRQAYSRESLHTFKAGDRQKGNDRGRGRGRGAGSRGRRTSRGETGRGQPNMKLRMDAMLEKIKQTMV